MWQHNLKIKRTDGIDQLPEGDFYTISDYGYGDGACYGPFTALEALDDYCQKQYCKSLLELLDSKDYGRILTVEEIWNGSLDTSMMHHITNYDRSEDFEDFMSS